ncbi:MAG: PIN domain-containing protein [Magnetococcales bacterium]|nr:PIN domain-containing protein [Magnetococcales bacterium]
MKSWLVDTNVLIDHFQGDTHFGERAREILGEIAESGELVINPVIYAELAGWFEAKEELDLLLPTDLFRHEPIPPTAAFLAGQVFRQYRQRGGQKKRMLADFLIGAHATVQGYGLISRDRGYGRYFRVEQLDPTAEIH